MKHTKKDLSYYSSLPYKIEIEPILEEEGGGYFARLPQFGRMGITGDGETIEEALEELEDFKKRSFERFLKEGKSIPEPEKQDKKSETFNGKILVRTPKDLHQTIAEKAKDNGVSQNQYINYLLTKALEQDLHNQTQFNPESLAKKIVKELQEGNAHRQY